MVATVFGTVFVVMLAGGVWELSEPEQRAFNKLRIERVVNDLQAVKGDK